MIDGRTKSATEAQILKLASQPGGFHTTSFWIDENRKRAGAVTRLLQTGAIIADKHGFPRLTLRLPITKESK